MGNSLIRLLFGADANGPVVTDWRCLGYTLLRVFFGFAIFMHGYPFMTDSAKIENFSTYLAGLNIPMPLVAAWAAKGTECVGGILLALGLATRPAAIALAGTLAVAAFVANADQAFFAGPGEASKEQALLYLVPFVSFAIMGPGAIALDRFILPLLPKNTN